MKRLYIVIICCLAATVVHAQTNKKSLKKGSPAFNNKKAKEDAKFLEKQWWIGLKAGPNLSKAIIEKQYSVLSPTNYEIDEIAKEYEGFKKLGSQATLEVTFYFKGFSFSLQPTYRHAQFAYTNNYIWMDSEDASNTLVLNYEQEHKVDHAIVPLVIKYEITGNKLRPYVQIGSYLGFLLNASKTVNITGIDYASGGENQFKNEPIVVGAKDLFAKKHWGLAGGVGMNYNLGNVRLNLDIMYHYGMSNITSTKARYNNDRLAGVGDAMDDMSMDNMLISIGCLFPMRFLESGFKSLDRKK